MRKLGGKILSKKSMSGKRKASSKRVPGGYPQIAHPTNTAAYQWQCCFVYDWFFTMLERLKGDDAEAARSAREALEGLFLEFTSTVLGLAKAGKDKTTKQWGGKLLASIGGSIQKHDQKLSNANKAYRLEQKKFGNLRVDVLFPKGIGIVVQRELKKAERLRRRLLVIQKTCGRPWREVVKRQRIPESYLPTMKLPEFSVKSEPQWWEFLWPFIGKKIDVSKMPKLKKHDDEHGGIKERIRYVSDSQTACRDHLQSLARQRDAGVL
jgi:hypothetical protein